MGQRMQRKEDEQLLTGQALFVDDVHLPDLLHVAFLRSDYAHARIVSIDVSKALAMEGVVAVYTAHDLKEYWQNLPLLVSPPPIENAVFHARTQVPLAKDKVRYVGEPVVMVLAQSRYIAEDAIHEIVVDYDPLEPVVDMQKALDSKAPLIHEDLPNNLAAHIVQKKGDYEAIRKEADFIIHRRFYYDHGIAAAMENRGVVASWDSKSGKLSVWDTTQAPIIIRNGLARMLDLPHQKVHLIAPFVGGGFGPKVMMFYPEEVLIPWVAKKLERSVKWIEDRHENFLATTHERDQIHEAEIAITKEGKVLGVKDVFLHDTGAYDPYGLTVPINSQCTLLGPYDVANYFSEFKVVFTNKMIVTPYRGAGRQHGVFVMERLLDLAAQKIGITPVEIRKRNYIPTNAFPYSNKIIYQDFAPLTYDSGNYLPALEKAVEMIGYEKFIREDQPRLKAQGKYAGIGIVSYVEGTGIGPYEGARVSIEPSGKVSVATGVGTQGQGHFTSFVQIISDVLKVDPNLVYLVTGDTDQIHWGVGTFASRGMVVAGNACYAAAMAVREKIFKLGSEIFQTPREELELREGQLVVKNAPEKKMTLGEMAAKANPLRGAVKPGTEPGLEATSYFGPAMGATSSGVQAMILEVDPQTMMVEIQKYVVVHDCGTIINPMIVEGQIHGGVAQGLGNAYFEKIVYDENGQLITASFMDYLLPRATDIPHMDLGHIETPSPNNPLGVKGVGEAGAIPATPLFAQAIENAFAGHVPLEILEMPLSPTKLFEIVSKNRQK